MALNATVGGAAEISEGIHCFRCAANAGLNRSMNDRLGGTGTYVILFALNSTSQTFSIFHLCAFFPPPFKLLRKEIEAQRTRRLIKVDILALNLIALHKRVSF
jgi:hypothetical protein